MADWHTQGQELFFTEGGNPLPGTAAGAELTDLAEFNMNRTEQAVTADPEIYWVEVEDIEDLLSADEDGEIDIEALLTRQPKLRKFGYPDVDDRCKACVEAKRRTCRCYADDGEVEAFIVEAKLALVLTASLEQLQFGARFGGVSVTRYRPDVRNTDALDFSKSNQPVWQKVVEEGGYWEDRSIRARSDSRFARRIAIGVPTSERWPPFIPNLDRRAFEEQLKTERSEKDADVRTWLNGRRVLVVDQLFYWGNPVERFETTLDLIGRRKIVEEIDPVTGKTVRSVQVTGYRQGVLLTKEEVEHFNSLDLHGQAITLGAEMPTEKHYNTMNYPAWRKRRPTSWKAGKARYQFGHWGRIDRRRTKPEGWCELEWMVTNDDWEVFLEEEEDLLEDLERNFELISWSHWLDEEEALEKRYDWPNQFEGGSSDMEIDHRASDDNLLDGLDEDDDWEFDPCDEYDDFAFGVRL